jgi:hypothetical protein
VVEPVEFDRWLSRRLESRSAMGNKTDIGRIKLKGNSMRASVIRIAIFAGIGAIAMMVPATASPTVSGSTQARPAQAIELQYARTCTATDTDPMCRQTRSFYKKHKKKTSDEKHK